MRNLRKLGAAVVLTFVLALSAFAGEVQTPPAPPPPDPGTPAACGSSQTGDTNPGNISTQPSVNNVSVITEVTLDLLQSALMFF